MEPQAEKNQQQQVACFNCRSSRQKCDRQDPCSRCAAHDRPCKYPARSNRGRKHGSTNKPDTIYKLLARIEESGAREEVLTALLGSSLPSPNAIVSLRGTPWTKGQASDSAIEHSRDGSSSSHLLSQYDSSSPGGSPEAESLVSPTNIVTAAIAANSFAGCDKLWSQTPLQPGAREAIMTPIKERLATYFASNRAQQKDWEILATQSVDSPFKLERSTCDPLVSRLIDDKDTALYFQYFFQLQNPLIGLLDATLHTPEYVYATSFTLFSVICALGCAVSVRPRDRVIYQVLMSLATGNIRWSIAATVKSLGTIQAIINMQYWAPIGSRQADDPYWLSLSHAVQLAREMGISRPDVVSDYVNIECQDSSPEFRERCVRNYERTWLYTFIADKGFGIMNGRSHCVSWKEMPRSAAEWWKSSVSEPSDRIISGIIEIRGLLLQAMQKRRHIALTPTSILECHKEAYDTLTQVRNERCAADDLSSAKYLPVLAFYMDHSILVLNAQALRDITATDDSMVSAAVLAIERKSIEVASRALDLIATNKTMADLSVGFQNNQYIMICYAMIEILRAIKRGGLAAEETSSAAEKAIGFIPFLDRVVQLLPASSAAHLYYDLARFFACQIDSLVSVPDPQVMRETIDPVMFTDDWFKSVASEMPEVAAFLNMGHLGMDQSMMETDDFLGLNDFGSFA
ncbi:hypothetical protein FOVSG1_006551 [Fusarium oxysporum f. sp. vasinfectum]